MKDKLNWLNWIIFKLLDQRGEVGEGDPPASDPPSTDSPSTDPPATDPPASDPPPPVAASADDVKQLKDSHQSLSDTLQRVQGALEALSSRPAATPASSSAPAVEDISDETLDGVLNEGKGASQIRKAWKADMAKMSASLDAKIEQLQSFGINALSEHGEQLAETHMPYKNHPRVKAALEGELVKARKSNPELLSSILVNSTLNWPRSGSP